MKNLIAETTLTGDYGHVEPGDKFRASDEVAASLIERKLVTESTDEESAETDKSESDEESEQKDDKDASKRKTKVDKTVTTDNLS